MKTLIAMFISALVLPSMSFALADLGSREVLLDNEKVELVRLVYPPGTESGMHSHKHPSRTVYFVKGGRLALIPENPAEQTKILTVAHGKVLYLPATSHNVKNLGDTEIIIIENEIK